MRLKSGAALSFDVSGTVKLGADPDAAVVLSGPDGLPVNVLSHLRGAQNGIADTVAPFGSLVGVFLSDADPDATASPPLLRFHSAPERDFTVLHPGLKQPFFIGDGLTGVGMAQKFIVPTGATRLYLGVMHATGWNKSTDAFTVAVQPSQASHSVSWLLLAGLPLTLSALMAFWAYGRNRRPAQGAPNG